jgi:hypothetical protein
MVVKSSSIIECCAHRWQDHDDLCGVSCHNWARYWYFGVQNEAIRLRVKVTTKITTKVRKCNWCFVVFPPEKGRHCIPLFKTPGDCATWFQSTLLGGNLFLMLILKLFSHICVDLTRVRKIILPRIECFIHPSCTTVSTAKASNLNLSAAPRYWRVTIQLHTTLHSALGRDE